MTYLFQRFESQNGAVGAWRLFRASHSFPGYRRQWRRRGRNRHLNEGRLGAPEIVMLLIKQWGVVQEDLIIWRNISWFPIHYIKTIWQQRFWSSSSSSAVLPLIWRRQRRRLRREAASVWDSWLRREWARPRRGRGRLQAAAVETYAEAPSRRHPTISGGEEEGNSFPNLKGFSIRPFQGCDNAAGKLSQKW